MQNWSKERRGQKQNNEFQPFQIKTKQYTNLTTSNSIYNSDESSYSPKQTPKSSNFQRNDYKMFNREDQNQNMSFKQRYNLDDNSPNQRLYQASFEAINQKNNFDKIEVKKTSKNSNLDVDYRKNLKEDVYKSPIKKDPNVSSFEINSKLFDISHSQSFKKENAKKKGLEMKMTNIDTISGQINSLLNMVNKNKRVTDASTNKSINKFQQKDYPRDKEDSLQRYEARINKSPLKNMPVEPNTTYQKRQKRERIYSDLNNEFREQFDSKKRNNKYICNEEENKWIEQPKPNKNYKYSSKSPHDHQKYLQNKSLEKPSHPYQRQHTKSFYDKQQPYSDQSYKKNVSPFRNSDKKYEQGFIFECSPKKHAEHFEKIQTVDKDRKYSQYTPKYLKNRQKVQKPQSQFLPLSIQKRSLEKKPIDNSKQATGIQQHLKRLKVKVQESEQKNYKYQQLLKDRQYDINNQQQKPAGKLYKRNEQKSQFQLKVYPVKIEKPNTVKIAEKISEQILLDQKLTFSRMQLEKQQDQYKWSQIQLGLKAKQLKMTKFQIQKLLQMSQQEVHMNSYQAKPSSSRKNITDLLVQAQRNWQKEVYGCASMKGLKAQSFNPQSLGSNNGYISLQNLTNFVNTYTGRQYSDTDIIMVYRRLQLLQGSMNNQQVQFNTFLRAVAI